MNEKIKQLELSEKSNLFLLVDESKWTNFIEFLENIPDEALTSWYRIFTQGNHVYIDTIKEIIMVNAMYIYMKELDIKIVEDSDDRFIQVFDGFCNSVISYYLYKNGYVKGVNRKYFENLYSLIKNNKTTLDPSKANPDNLILPKIYLDIPYSGMEDSAYQQVTKKSAELIEKGYNVFSPITHSYPLHQLGLKGDWEFWSKIDYQYLDWCDEVWVLIPKEGYQKVLQSTGVKGKIEYAQKLNKPVRLLGVTDESQLINLIKQDEEV